MEIREDLGPLRRRSAAVLLVVFILFGGLHLRLAQLQVLEGTHWRQMAENNRLRRLPVPSFRGRIYDRRGVVLADNRPSWELLLFPDEARDLDATALFLARLGVGDAATVHQRLSDRLRRGLLAPMVVGEELSWDQVARTRAHQSEYPELSVVSGFRRHYPFAAVTAHALGHLRPVDRAALEADPHRDPEAMIGATGVEALAESFLAGEGGDRWVVVTAVGQQLGVVREVESRPGRDLAVTLDIALQQEAAFALGEAAGAVVAIDASSGAVRVLYSAPAFDPNVFVGRLSHAEWAALRDDPRHPLQDRCVQGAYPPGSTIKPFLLLGALAEGTVSPQWGVTCRGSVVLHGHRFRCWNRSGHGRVGLQRSLEVSCDSYYYHLGQTLGIERMAAWLGRFGFGQPSGIGLTGERAGLIGTPAWSRRVRHQPWYPGEAVSVSIGQGPVLATTVQLARAFAALANGGRLVTPHLIAGGEQDVDLGLDPDHLRDVVAGLHRAVHGREGTARRLSSLPVAGKTGTAQVVRLQEGKRSDELAPHLRHHAWFVGWAPLDDPKLVVAVLVEHGGGGGRVATPVAGAVLRAALTTEDTVR